MIAEKIRPNRLPRDYIKVGNVIWYSGQTSVLEWNCPAEIIEVDDQRRIFKVMSLDDCRPQKQAYPFDVDAPYIAESRMSMFVPSEEELDLWLKSEVGIFQSTGIEERDGFVVMFDARYHPAFQWAIERWARKNGIETNYGIDIAFRAQFRFQKMEDAALCHLTFSQGVNWSMIK